MCSKIVFIIIFIYRTLCTTTADRFNLNFKQYTNNNNNNIIYIFWIYLHIAFVGRKLRNIKRINIRFIKFVQYILITRGWYNWYCFNTGILYLNRICHTRRSTWDSSKTIRLNSNNAQSLTRQNRGSSVI